MSTQHERNVINGIINLNKGIDELRESVDILLKYTYAHEEAFSKLMGDLRSQGIID